MLWESTADLTAPIPPNQATELIEYPPTHQMTTDIKATTDGTHTSQTLADPRPNLQADQETIMNAPTLPPATPEFSTPPPNPISLVRTSSDNALTHRIHKPDTLTLATTDTHRHTPHRIMHPHENHDTDPVFTTHTSNRQDRDPATTNGTSSMLYWHKTNQQAITTDPTHPLPHTEPDTPWTTQPISTHPISTPSQQNTPPPDKNTPKTQTKKLNHTNLTLPHPTTSLDHQPKPTPTKLWQTNPNQLHHKLHHKHTNPNWHTDRLQP